MIPKNLLEEIFKHPKLQANSRFLFLLVAATPYPQEIEKMNPGVCRDSLKKAGNWEDGP
jgi:hypothetical protein